MEDLKNCIDYLLEKEDSWYKENSYELETIAKDMGCEVSEIVVTLESYLARLIELNEEGEEDEDFVGDVADFVDRINNL